MSLLFEPSPDWPDMAMAEINRWRQCFDRRLVTVHHIGSTSVPGLAAKPILDLLPVFVDEAALDAAASGVKAMGYEWLGPFGLPGRRYCRLDDPGTGQRKVQAHAYADGSPEITRHLSFRDWLRAKPENARAYEAEKQRCAHLFPGGGAAYQECKAAWIDAAEAHALEVAP